MGEIAKYFFIRSSLVKFFSQYVLKLGAIGGGTAIISINQQFIRSITIYKVYIIHYD